MSSWVITYNGNSNSLMDDYKTITGKTAKEALRKAFNKDFERLTGENGRYADVILVKGTFVNNTIRPDGRYQMLCYGIKQ